MLAVSFFFSLFCLAINRASVIADCRRSASPTPHHMADEAASRLEFHSMIHLVISENGRNRLRGWVWSEGARQRTFEAMSLMALMVDLDTALSQLLSSQLNLGGWYF